MGYGGVPSRARCRKHSEALASRWRESRVYNTNICVEIVVISRDSTLVALVLSVKKYSKSISDIVAYTFLLPFLEMNIEHKSTSVECQGTVSAGE